MKDVIKKNRISLLVLTYFVLFFIFVKTYIYFLPSPAWDGIDTRARLYYVFFNLNEIILYFYLINSIVKVVREYMHQEKVRCVALLTLFLAMYLLWDVLNRLNILSDGPWNGDEGWWTLFGHGEVMLLWDYLNALLVGGVIWYILFSRKSQK